MIRPATHDDIPALAALGQSMADESPEWRGMGYSQDKVAAMLQQLIGSPRGFVMVAEHGGTVCAVMVAAATEHWACTALVAFELALYVSPSARGACQGIQLIRAYRQWVADLGALRGTAGVSVGLDDERTGLLYERAGARRLGIVFDVVGD